FEVVHISQYIYELINEGRIQITKEYARKVTYHDPCYLGRHNGVFDEPRGILQKIPGLTLTEMAEVREDSLCCGMGGGRAWMETEKNERFANLRVEQAVRTGAQVLATACPYCVFALEDSRLVTNHADDIEIKDITEILQEVI
ncbi:MAG TPA: (Fe-S)-binding protein, partial [Syntrophorhabdaceae bacterium]|nr:(Fe-S)-binding protein [Syntrophorhabdaceae bacterium]